MQDLMNLIALYKEQIENEKSNLNYALTKKYTRQDEGKLEILKKVSQQITMLTFLGSDLFYSETKPEFDVALENLKKQMNKYK